MDVAKVREGLRKQGVYVAEGDPVLELVAICELALVDTLKSIDAITRQQADRVTAASTQAVESAKKEAELLLTEGSTWFEGRFKAAGEAAAALVLANLRQETLKAERASRVAVRAAWATAVGGFVVMCGLGGMVLASLGHP